MQILPDAALRSPHGLFHVLIFKVSLTFRQVKCWVLRAKAEAGHSLHNFPAPGPSTSAYLALGEHDGEQVPSQDLSKLTQVAPFSWFQSPSLHPPPGPAFTHSFRAVKRPQGLSDNAGPQTSTSLTACDHS